MNFTVILYFLLHINPRTFAILHKPVQKRSRQLATGTMILTQNTHTNHYLFAFTDKLSTLAHDTFSRLSFGSLGNVSKRE